MSLSERAAPVDTLGEKGNIFMDRTIFQYLFGMLYFHSHMGRPALIFDFN